MRKANEGSCQVATVYARMLCNKAWLCCHSQAECVESADRQQASSSWLGDAPNVHHDTHAANKWDTIQHRKHRQRWLLQPYAKQFESVGVWCVQPSVAEGRLHHTQTPNIHLAPTRDTPGTFPPHTCSIMQHAAVACKSCYLMQAIAARTCCIVSVHTCTLAPACHSLGTCVCQRPSDHRRVSRKDAACSEASTLRNTLKPRKATGSKVA